MPAPVERSVLDLIRSSRLISPGDRVGVAVSGGADSVALLRLLQSLRGELGITLVVLHLNHCLRAAESEADADFVRRLASGRDLECIVSREDVAAAAASNHWNTEDAGRRLRYAFFERIVREGYATRVAVAHTADDQAETVLAHLLRGTGPAGLGGIYPTLGSIVRPLLSTRRQELREYLRELGQSWREDSTNADSHRARVRIRLQLLPVLERDFSPQVVSHLNELARLSREENAFWSVLVDSCFSACVRKVDRSFVISASDLLSPWQPLLLPKFQSAERPPGDSALGNQAIAPTRSLTERLIRRLYENLRGDRAGLSSGHVEQVIRLAASSLSGRRVQLPRGIEVERNFDQLVFRCSDSRASAACGVSKARRASSQPAYRYAVSLPDSGSTTISVAELGTCFSLKIIDWPAQERDTKSEGVALDADLLRPPLILRNWQPGDAYRPCGRRQPRKLKQVFLERRVPLPDRWCWPVLESAGKVIWARNMAPAADFAATARTRIGLIVEEVITTSRGIQSAADCI